MIPKTRNDNGVSRKIYPELEAGIHELRTKYPKAPATIIHSKLIENNLIEQKDFSVCTLQRYFKTHPIDINQPAHQKDRKAYESEYVNGI